MGRVRQRALQRTRIRPWNYLAEFLGKLVCLRRILEAT